MQPAPRGPLTRSCNARCLLRTDALWSCLTKLVPGLVDAAGGPISLFLYSLYGRYTDECVHHR